MIVLKRELVNEIETQCAKEFPNEACGILAGRAGKVEKVYEMTNIEKSAATFFMDPKEQLNVMKEIRNLRLEMAGIYHSHVASEAYPSARDLELAFYPGVSYVIVSLKDRNSPRIRSFKINDGKINEEEVKIE